MKYYNRILNFFETIDADWDLPSGVELIYPFNDIEVLALMKKFYQKYFNDSKKRHFLFGINPGRLGAGMTGIPFTDPIQLKVHCDISNDLMPKSELSSIFIYEMIQAYGGVSRFYRNYYVSSICPLGFLKEGKNYNYYDSKHLYNTVKDHIISSIEKQLEFPCFRDRAFSIGKGKNFTYFKMLNEERRWFVEIIPLPHPRWVLQYKRKNKEKYIAEYLEKLS